MRIAIQGHPTRGKEVIQILESLGGINSLALFGTATHRYYHICDDNIIRDTFYETYYKIYTLEAFEQKFPFKVGDIVTVITDTPYKIVALEYYMGRLCYRLDNGLNYNSETLTLYKEMKERTVTLSLEKAKEWYSKGGELKEIALQAFTEKELNPLPKTWEEFCNNYMIDDSEAYFDSCCTITSATATCRESQYDRNICPSKKSAEAHLALIQLEQLRNCWWNGWEPDWNDDQQAKYCIVHSQEFKIHILYETRRFLSFPTIEMAEEFLKCFRNLIEQAGDLI